ncbi:hypothetical protein EV363DRAFT_1551847 [Boletus edulis]|uniref:Uncharacterized protein n=1 Tax=Boletus edulis BED1 TaxID=1328754 RepID=A0AAD4BVW4_BOLED|nr:hypothetical protein EV363DRAFT_1551847 [Boletus edulis]KAF8441548.1 hypothetical protein L210DRAFT_3664444 [Boletus edulis BED1]
MDYFRTLLGGIFGNLLSVIIRVTAAWRLPFPLQAPNNDARVPPPGTGVTFSPAAHPANPFPQTNTVSPLKVLKKAYPDVYPLCKETLHCSLGDAADIIPQRNGFVHTVLECYSKHRALVLRPDDVWLAIMTQFYCLVNGRAEELRSLFVQHDGKKKLTMVFKEFPRTSLDMDNLVGTFAEKMSEAVQENVVDPELRSWMLPAFSTTTRTDLVATASVMLGTVKEYFTFRIMLLCGIPRVTLLGEKQDWEAILDRIEKLKEFGSDAMAWYRLLRPVLSRFLRAFDEPHHPDNLDFWNKVADLERLGSGPTWLSGWITAFMMFDEKGKWMGDANKEEEKELVLDGVAYPLLDSEAVPAGYAQVDVELQVGEDGDVNPTILVAGFIGTRIQSSGDETLSETGKRDTACPEIAWWWVLKAEPSEQPDVAPLAQDDDLSYLGQWI